MAATVHCLHSAPDKHAVYSGGREASSIRFAFASTTRITTNDYVTSALYSAGPSSSFAHADDKSMLIGTEFNNVTNCSGVELAG